MPATSTTDLKRRGYKQTDRCPHRKVSFVAGCPYCSDCDTYGFMDGNKFVPAPSGAQFPSPVGRRTMDDLQTITLSFTIPASTDTPSEELAAMKALLLRGLQVLRQEYGGLDEFTPDDERRTRALLTES